MARSLIKSDQIKDGAGSDLDADKFDGQDSEYYTTDTELATVSGVLNNKIEAIETGLPDNYYNKTEVDSLIDTASGTLQNQIDGLDSTKLNIADIDDTPVNGVTTAPISSNWAYDHTYAADPHASATSIGGLTIANIWHTGNDGVGSGLDADTVDGVQASQFLRSDANDFTTNTIAIGKASNAVGANLEVVGNAVINGVLNSNISRLVLTRTDRSFKIANETSLRIYSAAGEDTNPLTQLFEIQHSTGNTTLLGTLTVNGASGTINGNTIYHTGNDSNLAKLNVVNEFTASQTLNTTSDSKIQLKGTSDPYISFYENDTLKGYLRWYQDGYMWLRNLEDSSALRLKDDLDFSPDGTNFYSIYHEGNDSNLAKLNGTQTFTGINTFDDTAIANTFAKVETTHSLISYPDGAFFQGGVSETGAIKITLPTTPSTNCTIKLTLKVVNHNSIDESFDVVIKGVTAYATSSWTRTTAYILGSPNNDRNFSVRFGHDGSNFCIYVAELTTNWVYPQFFITEFYVLGNYVSYFDSGWSIGIESTAFGTIALTTTKTQIGRYVDGNTVYHEGNDSNLAKLDGTQTFTGTNTFSGNIDFREDINSSILTTGNPQVLDTNTTTIYLGNSSTQLILQSNGTSPIYYDGANRNIYHTGNDSNLAKLSSANTFTASQTIDTDGGDVNTPITALVVDNEYATATLIGGGTAIELKGKSSGGNISNYQQARLRSYGYSSNNSHGFVIDVKPDAGSSLTPAFSISNVGDLYQGNFANIIYHAGNDGSGSGLDADLLEGQHGSYYLNASNINAGTIGDAYLPATISSDITGNSATADKLSTARQISLTGDVTGSANFDGSQNVSITATVADDSHNHIIGNVDGLQTALDGKISSTGVTYENLNSNGDVGTGAAQVAVGNHTHTGSNSGSKKMLSFYYEGEAQDEDVVVDGIYFDENVSITAITINARVAPTGAALTVDVIKAGSEQSKTSTLATDASYQKTTFGAAASFSTSDRFGIKIKSVGSTEPGQGLNITVHYATA